MFHLDTRDLEGAKKALERAETLIEKMSYGQKTAEMWLRRAEYLFRAGDRNGAVDYTQKAKKRIEEIGQLGLMPEFKRVRKLVGWMGFWL